MSQRQIPALAEESKERGNLMFSKQKYNAAIEAYTEAITLCPTWSVPLVNRALCHRRKSDWAAVAADCKMAISMDAELFKAQFLLGLVHMEANNWPEAIQRLQKALELAHDKGAVMLEEIWRQLARAKYSQWQVASVERAKRHERTADRMRALLHAEAERRQEAGVSSAQVKQELEQGLQDIEETLREAGAKDQAGEIPGWCCCSISMEPFRDPVITPEGLSYEREKLNEHFTKVGKFDPVTRKQINPSLCVKNVNMRQAVQKYLDENAWAWGECAAEA